MLILTKEVKIYDLLPHTNYTVTKAVVKSNNTLLFEIKIENMTYEIESKEVYWLYQDLCTVSMTIEDRTVMTRKDVIKLWFKNPKDLEIYYFFGHKQHGKDIDDSCLSQWFKRYFVVEGTKYICMEQYMMQQKAILFNDLEIAEEIMKNTNPSTIKRLGRQVSNFNTKIWNKHKYNIVLKGNICKFIYNTDLITFIKNTGADIFAEASPYDDIWGIKLSEEKAYTGTPQNWNGLNLLGFVLTDVKDFITSNLR